ncbi:MAG: anthranilate phosphoribosyltransferase [Candidatus Goldiibacteriota bacterium]
MLKKFIKTASEGNDLSVEKMKEAMNMIMTGQSNDAQIAAFLTALRMKGESVDEIYAAAKVMRDRGHKVEFEKEIILDTCGTGGDGAKTFNISTGVSIVAAAAGICVAKHGNRALTSRSGSADVFAALGVNIEMTPEEMKLCVQKAGIAFLFAPGCHKAMKYAMNVRKEIGIRTIFNLLGPLANPARNTHHLMGVFDEELTEKAAGVLKKMGNVHSLVVCGEGNVDEAVLSGYTKISELKDGEIMTYRIKPEEFGIAVSSLEAIAGGSPEENAEIITEIFSGQRKDAYYDALVFNGGIALYTADAAADIKEGIRAAKDIIDSGKAALKMNEFVECSNK